jgi:hypothetical protein
MTAKQRLAAYEHFFHVISMNCTAMNNDRIRDAVSLIDNWSYAHRVGNGELSDYETRKMIDKYVKRMEEF